MKRTIAALAVLALVGACGEEEASMVPDDPEAVVVSVASEGGFVPVEFNLDRMPRYVLTADRSLYFQGPVPAIYPGPLLPNVQVVTVTEDAFDEVLRLIGELGLPEIDDETDNSGAEMVADATTEVITYYDPEGDAHRLGIYALGIVEGGSTDRLLANELVQTLEQATAGGEAQPFQAERLQVAAGPAVQSEEGFSTVQAWPLTVAFEEMGEWALGWRCTEVTGGDVAALLDVFEVANQATLWDTGTEEVSIRTRPLLPGETACAGAPQGR